MRDFEYEPKVIVKRKGSFLGKFVAFILGIVVGIVGGFGGVAYAGYYIVTKVKIEDAVNTVNGFSGLGIDYTQYISGDYGQKTVRDLVGDAYEAVMGIVQNSGTLQDLDDISPLVYDLIAGKEAEDGTKSFNLVDFLKGYGVELDADKMMGLIVVKPAAEEGEEATADPDTYLMDYIIDCVNKMPAANLFSALKIQLHPMLDALINGVDGNDPITIGELMGEDLMTRVYSLPVDLFLENLDKTDNLMMTLAYGPAYRYTVNGSDVAMNPVFYTYNVSEGKLYDGDGNDVTLNIQTFDMQAGTCTLTVGEETQYLKVEASESTAETVKFYAYTDDSYVTVIKYKETTVGELSNISDTLLANLTIGDVVEDTSGNKILEAIADTKVKDVPAKLETLTIGEIIEAGDNKILQALSTSTLSSLKDDIYDVELTAVIEPDTENSIIMYLLYGKEGVHYQVETNGDITPLQKRVAMYNGVVYNEYGEEITGATVNGDTYTLNGVTYTLSVISEAEELKLDQKKVAIYGTNVYETDGTSATLLSGAVAETSAYTYNGETYILKRTSDTINVTVDGSQVEANIYYVRDEYNIVAPWYYVSDENGEPVKYAATTLGDLQGENASLLSNLTSRLTVGDVMGDVSDNKILNHLADVTISGLSDAIHDLTIKDVFEEDMYITNANGEFLDASGNVTTNPDEYVMKHTWEYMLLDPTTGELHHEYTLEDNMNDLMDNFQKNVQHNTLEKLINDGIIEFEGETDDEKATKKTKFMNAHYTVVVTDENGDPVTDENGVPTTKDVYLHDMTIPQLLDFIVEMLETANA